MEKYYRDFTTIGVLWSSLIRIISPEEMKVFIQSWAQHMNEAKQIGINDCYARIQRNILFYLEENKESEETKTRIKELLTFVYPRHQLTLEEKNELLIALKIERERLEIQKLVAELQ